MHNEQSRGQQPGAMAKYLRRTSSGVAGIGLDTTIKYLRHTTSGAAGISRANLLSTCKAQRAAPGL
jgi:hypothetical protein